MIDEDRIYPHNLEAERCVLGAIMVDEIALSLATRILQPRDFFRMAHRSIFKAMIELDGRKSAIDVVTLSDAISRNGEMDEVGGRAFLSQLTDGVPRSVNIAHYALLVRDESRRREIIRLGKEMVDQSYNPELETGAIIQKADRALIKLTQGRGENRMTELASLDVYQMIQSRYENRGQLLGVTTGSPKIDAQTFGWQAGELIVLGARPSVGKTAITLSMAIAAARAGTRVAFFSLEMRLPALQARMLATLSGVNCTNITTGHLGSKQLEAVGLAGAEMQSLPICIDDSGSQTASSIRSSCRTMKSDGGLGLVIIDYVQLMTGQIERSGVTRNEEIGDASRRLKIMADEIQSPVILLSQLSRAASDRPPTLADLRDSGALEQDGDYVCFLHRKNHRQSGPTSFIIEKQRNGSTGTVGLLFDRDTQRFEDGPDEVETEEHPPADDGSTRKRARR